MAEKLATIRQAKKMTQTTVGEAMHVRQNRVSAIESTPIEHLTVATLKLYVQALGGTVEIYADFGDDADGNNESYRLILE
jgi:transcriptional regulator with XRE-family HTH domain